MIEEAKLMRRVAGYHDIRMDGMLDLVIRARGSSVLDLGCNRGLVGFEMANNGARLVHGCDIDEECIWTARRLFIDLRNVENRFEVVDLAKGHSGLGIFGRGDYDIILMLATYHKIKRVMKPELLSDLMRYLGSRCKLFGWRATSDKADENEVEMKTIDKDLGEVHMRRIHTSYISNELGVAAIWRKK